MDSFFEHLCQSGPDDDILVMSGDTAVTRSDLLQQVDELIARLHSTEVASVALYADNGIDWIVTDLACQRAGLRMTPLPLFFSAGQIAHAIADCGADALITDRSADHLLGAGIHDARFVEPLAGSTDLYMLSSQTGADVALPTGTQKITFTSGTTGTPKGVCLSSVQQFAVARAIASAIDSPKVRHLCVLPLTTLLENVAGVYAPLLTGGTIIAPPLADLGLTGSSRLDIGILLEGLSRHRPCSLILVPQMLAALCAAAEAGWPCPSSLKFIAVGGGKVSPDLLTRAFAAGLPAYEGYGLSECASVVSLNVPGAERQGSVGRPLPHAEVAIVDGEIVITSNAFLGYAGQPDSWNKGAVRTGDIGRIDDDGYVYVEGRVKNQIITSFGRNLSPEWVESELLAGPFLRQAIVFGDAQPYCVALLYPYDESTTDQDIADFVRHTNRRLPDYARVLDWRRLPCPIGRHDGTATENSRPRRDRIERKYRSIIDAMYTHQREALSQ